MILVLVEVAKNTNSAADDKQRNPKQIKSQTIKLKKTQTAIFNCLSFFYSQISVNFSLYDYFLNTFYTFPNLPSGQNLNTGLPIIYFLLIYCGDIIE